MPIIPSTEFKTDSPFVQTCVLDHSSVVIAYNNELRLTLIPQRDDQGRIVGLEEFILTRHDNDDDDNEKDEDFAHYRSTSKYSVTYLKVSKSYLRELVGIALHDYLYWELAKHDTPEMLYAYNVVEFTDKIAEDLFSQAIAS